MCGRYNLTTPVEALRRLFGFAELPNLGPRYNIAPTQLAPVVRTATAGRRLDLLRWGLVPGWAKDEKIGNRLINARGETVAEQPAFRGAFRGRRCLVPADGFYEWRREGRARQPFNIVRADGRPMALAGLWERWSGPAGPLESFTIVTTTANDTLRALHDRMPVILEPEDWAAWLDGPPEVARELIRPLADGRLVLRPANPRVNSPRFDDPACLDAPEEADGDEGAGGPAAPEGRLL